MANDNLATVVIQEMEDDQMTLLVNGEIQHIRKDLAELKNLVQAQKSQTIQYADKIYNIEHINEANFGIVTSPRVFNNTLVKALMPLIGQKPAVQDFLTAIRPEEAPQWELVNVHLKEAQRLLEDSFVWILGWELRRLFAIGNDRQKPVEVKINEYIAHCFSTYRIALELLNFVLIAALWDYKKQRQDLQTVHPALRDFFGTRSLTHAELRQLLQALVGVYKTNSLDFPIPEIGQELSDQYCDAGSAFTLSCQKMEELIDMEARQTPYGLGHCHSAELYLAEILNAFPFFTAYQLVTMKKVEYEEFRNSSPRYVKDFSILEKKEAKTLQRMLVIDNRPSFAYALFFRNAQCVINLFPFILDFNALTNELDFQIYLYRHRIGQRGLRYFSVKNEEEAEIYFHGALADHFEITDEQKKRDLEREIRLDLAIRQYEDAYKTLLMTDLQFESPGKTPAAAINF